MRRKNTGTYDTRSGTWRIRAKNISASNRQLSRMFGVEITNKRDSEKLWRLYLDRISKMRIDDKRKNSPLQRRLQSIDDIRDDGKMTPELEKEYIRCLEIPSHDIDNADLPVIHPDIERIANVMMLDERDDFELSLLAGLKPKAITKKENLKSEIDYYVDIFKKRGHKEYFQVRASLEIFLEITGHISVHDVSVDHYRKFVSKVKALTTCGQTTKSNKQKYLHRFLKNLYAIHKIHIGYITLPEYQIRRGKPKKEQYTFEQVQLALANATGHDRAMLLLGLNCGFYLGDILSITADNCQADYISLPRSKLKSNNIEVYPTWYMWAETKRVTECFGDTPPDEKKKLKGKMERGYWKFRNKYGLPAHKALRKTVAQWLDDNVSEKASRLYRGEAGGDCHKQSYIKRYSKEQIAMLTDALKKVAEWLRIE